MTGNTQGDCVEWCPLRGQIESPKIPLWRKPSCRTPPGRPGGNCQRRPLSLPSWEEHRKRREKMGPSSAIQSAVTSPLLGPNDHVGEGLLTPRMLLIERFICLLSSAGPAGSSAQSEDPEFQPKDTHPLTRRWVARKHQPGAPRLPLRSK